MTMEMKITHVIELSPALMGLLMSATSGRSMPTAAPAKQAVADAVATKSPVENILTASEAKAAAEVVPAAGENTGKRDAAGTLFDPARHTGSIVKSGLWRMKTGLSRPEGEGESAIPSATGAVAGAATTQATALAVTGSATVDEDDEFAAFTAAANAGGPVEVKARTWTDADLSKLTNQAAQKLGSPDVVKSLIAKHVKTGETPHSRNIPADAREAFAKDVEAAAGIEYAG